MEPSVNSPQKYLNLLKLQPKTKSSWEGYDNIPDYSEFWI